MAVIQKLRSRRALGAFVIVVAAVSLAANVAMAVTPFVDIAGNNHADNIEAIYKAGITTGCDLNHYCPNDPVTRGQMATFLARTAGLSAGAKKNFPLANARGQHQTYCALVAANPRSFDSGPCGVTASRVDEAGNVGSFSSIAIGANGFPIMSYWDSSTNGGDLKVAACTDSTCSAPAVITDVAPDPSNDGNYSSLTIGANGYPAIAYYDATTNDLEYVTCTDPMCANGSWIKRTLASTGDVGSFPSIVSRPDGSIAVSYYDNDNLSLNIAICPDYYCSTNTTVSLVGFEQGKYNSLALGADGFPSISFLDEDQGDLKFLHCNDAACADVDVSFVDTTGDVGGYTSLAIAPDGFPVISYQDNANRDLRFVKCSDNFCDAHLAPITLDALSSTGWYTSMAIGTDGFPAIAYYNASNQSLKYVHCLNATCTGATQPVLVDYIGADLGRYASLAIGVDGIPVISYADFLTFDLKVARPALN
jgi:hypothetical protein